MVLHEVEGILSSGGDDCWKTITITFEVIRAGWVAEHGKGAR
jgi:hypothetical protein